MALQKLTKFYIGDAYVWDASEYASAQDMEAVKASLGSYLGVGGNTDTVQAKFADIDTKLGTINSDITDINDRLNRAISSHLTYAVVSALPALNMATVNTVYLVPVAGGAGNNVYEEYLCYNKGTIESPVLAFERLGTTDVDLSGYYTKTETDSAITTRLANYYTKEQTDTEISTATVNMMRFVSLGQSAWDALQTKVNGTLYAINPTA